MGRLFKVLGLVCLLLLCVTAPASGPALAQPIDPTEVTSDTAVTAVNDLIRRMNEAAADVKAHRFAPAYYAEPCTPTKEDGERSLSEFRSKRRAFQAEIRALKARIAEIESFSSGGVELANHGWKVHDQTAFVPLDRAYRAFDTAITAKEAELDRMPVQPCRKAQPQPPQPRDPNGPLTAGEEAQFEDFPLALPVFDDPVTLPTPPKFCTYAERRAWMDSVYWPTVKRAQDNALKAIDAFGKAEARLREVRNNDRPDSPRIALAEQSVRYWEAEKNRRMAEHQRLLAIDVPNPVDCDPPSTTTGTTGGATTTTPPPVTTPLADGPAAAPPPPPPLPPGIVRPDLAPVTVPRLPARFCSEKEKLDFLVEVYHPAADAASKNALKTSAYRARLSHLIVEATENGDAGALAALKAEYDAFEPIADAADALAQRMYRMREQILRIPVVDCSKPEEPAASAPPVEDSGLAEIIVEGSRIRSDPPPRPQPLGPTPPKPPADSPKPPSDSSDLAEIIVRGERIRGDETSDTPTPATTGPKTPGPNLSRPQFERVREVTVPAKFCSEFERNDFLNNIYNPAVAAALNNARVAQAHQVKLNALFTEHMKANTEHWAAVRAERDAYEAVAREATAEAEALRQLYAKIMAVPVVPCETKTGDEADPVGEEPAGQTGQAGPTGPGEPRVEEGLPGFRSFEPLPPPGRFCTREEAEAYIRQVEARTAEIRGERDRLEEAVGASLGTNRTFLDSLWAPGEKDRLTDAEIRKREEEFYVSQGLIALSLNGRSMREFTNADAASYGRTRAALGTVGVQMLLEYDTQLKALEASRTKAEDMIAKGQFGPCPKDGDEPKKPCPPKKGRDPITVGPNSKVGSGAQLRSKLGGMATGAVLGALGVGGGGGSEPRLWVCKIKDSEYTVFNDPVTGVSLRVGAKRAKGGKVIIFSEIAKSPDKGTFQTAFLERPSTGETLAPSDIGPCDLWGEWKLTVSWTKTTYVNGQVVDRQSGGWSEGGFFKIPGTLSQMDAPDGFWKQMGFSSAQMGAREMGMIFDLPPGGGPLTFVIHVTRPKGDPVTTVPFVLTMTEGPGGGFTFTQAEDPPCPEEIPTLDGVSFDFGPDSTISPAGDGLVGLGGATTTAPPAGNPGPAGTTSMPRPTTSTTPPPPGVSTTDSGYAPRVDGRIGPTPEEAYAVKRAETGAQEMVAAWRASDAELLTSIRNQKDCDPTIRDRLLARFKDRERMRDEGGPEIFNASIRRAFELDGPRMNELKDLLGETACPATTPATSGAPPTGTTPLAPGGGTPATPGGGTPSGPATSTPEAPTTGLGSLPRPNTDRDQALHTSDLKRLVTGLDDIRARELADRRALDAARCKGPEAWEAERVKYLKARRTWLDILQRVSPLGPDAGAIQDAVNGEIIRVTEEILEVEGQTPPPAPKTCPPGEDTDVDSILDEIDEVFVPA